MKLTNRVSAISRQPLDIQERIDRAETTLDFVWVMNILGFDPADHPGLQRLNQAAARAWIAAKEELTKEKNA
jgi:hypothetical protein